MKTKSKTLFVVAKLAGDDHTEGVMDYIRSLRRNGIETIPILDAGNYRGVVDVAARLGATAVAFSVKDEAQQREVVDALNYMQALGLGRMRVIIGGMMTPAFAALMRQRNAEVYERSNSDTRSDSLSIAGSLKSELIRLGCLGRNDRVVRRPLLEQKVRKLVEEWEPEWLKGKTGGLDIFTRAEMIMTAEEFAFMKVSPEEKRRYVEILGSEWFIGKLARLSWNNANALLHEMRLTGNVIALSDPRIFQEHMVRFFNAQESDPVSGWLHTIGITGNVALLTSREATNDGVLAAIGNDSKVAFELSNVMVGMGRVLDSGLLARLSAMTSPERARLLSTGWTTGSFDGLATVATMGRAGTQQQVDAASIVNAGHAKVAQIQIQTPPTISVGSLNTVRGTGFVPTYRALNSNSAASIGTGVGSGDARLRLDKEWELEEYYYIEDDSLKMGKFSIGERLHKARPTLRSQNAVKIDPMSSWHDAVQLRSVPMRARASTSHANAAVILPSGLVTLPQNQTTVQTAINVKSVSTSGLLHVNTTAQHVAGAKQVAILTAPSSIGETSKATRVSHGQRMVKIVADVVSQQVTNSVSERRLGQNFAPDIKPSGKTPTLNETVKAAYIPYRVATVPNVFVQPNERKTPIPKSNEHVGAYTKVDNSASVSITPDKAVKAVSGLRSPSMTAESLSQAATNIPTKGAQVQLSNKISAILTKPSVAVESAHLLETPAEKVAHSMKYAQIKTPRNLQADSTNFDIGAKSLFAQGRSRLKETPTETALSSTKYTPTQIASTVAHEKFDTDRAPKLNMAVSTITTNEKNASHKTVVLPLSIILKKYRPAQTQTEVKPQARVPKPTHEAKEEQATARGTAQPAPEKGLRLQVPKFVNMGIVISALERIRRFNAERRERSMRKLLEKSTEYTGKLKEEAGRFDIQIQGAKVRDYYETLGIKTTHDQRAIRDAYISMVKRYHPDISKVANAEEMTKAINEAYTVLGDTETKARYDKELSKGTTALSAEAIRSMRNELIKQYIELRDVDVRVFNAMVSVPQQIESLRAAIEEFADWKGRLGRATKMTFKDLNVYIKRLRGLRSVNIKLMKKVHNPAKLASLRDNGRKLDELLQAYAAVERGISAISQEVGMEIGAQESKIAERLRSSV